LSLTPHPKKIVIICLKIIVSDYDLQVLTPKDYKGEKKKQKPLDLIKLWYLIHDSFNGDSDLVVPMILVSGAPGVRRIVEGGVLVRTIDKEVEK